MKKFLFPSLFFFLLVSLFSCSGLHLLNGSVAIAFPPDFIQIDNDIEGSSFLCSVVIDGDVKKTESKTYSSIAALNNSVFEIKNLPVNSKIQLSMYVYAENKILYSGSSSKFSVCAGKNYASLELNKIIVPVNPDDTETKDLLSIMIINQPTKTKYQPGETLDITGLTVHALYDDGTEEDITNLITVSDFDSNISGNHTITISYAEKTTNFIVTVLSLSDIGYAAAEIGDIILKNGVVVNPDNYISNGMAIVIRTATETEPLLAIGVEFASENSCWCDAEDSIGYQQNTLELSTSIINGNTFSGFTDGQNGIYYLTNAYSDASLESLNNYKAWEFCYNYGITYALTEFQNGWYLPTIRELALIAEKKDVINSSLNKVNNKSFSGLVLSASQTPDSNNDIWALNLADNSIVSSSKISNCFCYAVHAFGTNSQHKHPYLTTSAKNYDETGHWYPVICEHYDSEKAEYEDHSFDAGTVTLEPTNTSTGKKEFKCINCDYSYTIDIPKLTTNISEKDNFIFVEGATVTGPLIPTSLVFTDGKTLEIKNLYVCDHEVTQSEYYQIMGENPCSGTQYGYGDNYPVFLVSWYSTIVYCNKRSIAAGLTPCYSIKGYTDPSKWGAVPTTANTDWDNVICDWTANGYRLPKESEWEYIARGGKELKTFTYSGSDDVDKVAWTTNFSPVTSRIVKTKNPNTLNIYDMSGNVWEWCWSYTSDVTKRTSKGGCYNGTVDYSTVYARKNNILSYSKKNMIGFRVVRLAE